jgi:hypothetical protein
MKAAPAGESWERLTTANDDIEAQLLIGILEEENIPTRVVKDRSGYGDYLYGGSNPWAPVAVHVHPSHLDEARRAIESVEPVESSGTSNSDVSRRASWPTVIAVAIVGLIVLAFLLQQRSLFSYF